MWITLKVKTKKLDIPWVSRKGENMDQRLSDAARTGDIATLDLLLQEDPLLLNRLSVSSQDNPLHVAAFSGQAAFAAELLRHKQGLAKELNHQGFNPLHIASASGELEVVEVILSVLKADACLLKEKDGLIPLHFAAQRGRIEVMKLLISTLPDSLEQRTTSRETPLHVAVKNNQVEATRLLLKEIKRLKFDEGIVNLEDRDGNTVLHLATLGKQLLIVEMLIGNDAIIDRVEPNKQNRNWLTPKDILDVDISNVSEMYGIVQIFQTVEAKNAKERRKNLRESKKSRNPFRNIKNYLHDQVKNATSEERQTLMVVATLIATLTFTGIVQPPGGFKAEDSNGGGSRNTTQVQKARVFETIFGNRTSTAGQSIMAERRLDFTFYAAFSAIGFLASVSMISLLTRGYPLRNWMRLCIISMMCTYLVAIFYIAPDEDIFWLVILLASAFLVLREGYKFLNSLRKDYKKMGFYTG